MAAIISFPANHTIAYNNLIQLIPTAGDVDTLNFYIDVIGGLGQNNALLPGEHEELLKLARTTRLEKAAHAKHKQDVSGPGVYLYTPEMGQEKPDCQIEASLSYYGSHYFLVTDLALSGRGIKKLDPVIRSGKELSEYQVTKRAFEKLKTIYSISYKSLLD